MENIPKMGKGMGGVYFQEAKLERSEIWVC